MSAYYSFSDLNMIEPTDVSPISANDDRVNSYAISYETDICNRTGKPLTVIGRDGIPIEVRPQTSNHRKAQVIIKRTIRYRDSSTIDQPNRHHEMLRQPEGTSESIIARQISDHKADKFNHHPNKPRTVVCHYTYSLEDIEAHGGRVYSLENDLVISTRPNDGLDKTIYHPYSLIGGRDSLIEHDQEVNNKRSFGYSIYILNNNNTISARFININGEVYKVPAVKGHFGHDGVYVCTSGPLHTDSDHVPPRVVHYTDMAQAEKELRLFKTFDEARNFGNDEEEWKRQMKERERLLESENLQAKAEVERWRRSNEQLQEKLKHREYHRKDAHEENKHQFEKKSYHRRAMMEILKMIPVVISTAVAAWFKLKVKK